MLAFAPENFHLSCKHVIGQLMGMHKVYSKFIVIEFTGCVNFFPLSHILISKMLRKFIVSLDVATQLCAFEIFLGLLSLKAMSNEWLFMQVTVAPVTKSHENVLLTTFMFSRGLILSP